MNRIIFDLLTKVLRNTEKILRSLSKKKKKKRKHRKTSRVTLTNDLQVRLTEAENSIRELETKLINIQFEIEQRLTNLENFLP